MNITAGGGHSAIEKTKGTEEAIRKFEEAPCMEIGLEGVKICCKTPGNLHAGPEDRHGDIIRYHCIVCQRGHWRAFSQEGAIVMEGMAANARRIYELQAIAGKAESEGTETL